jgi:hypothetical protein
MNSALDCLHCLSETCCDLSDVKSSSEFCYRWKIGGCEYCRHVCGIEPLDVGDQGDVTSLS